MPINNETQSTIRCMWIATLIGALVFTGHFKNETLGVAALLALAIPSMANVFVDIFRKGK